MGVLENVEISERRGWFNIREDPFERVGSDSPRRRLANLK